MVPLVAKNKAVIVESDQNNRPWTTFWPLYGIAAGLAAAALLADRVAVLVGAGVGSLAFLFGRLSARRVIPPPDSRLVPTADDGLDLIVPTARQGLHEAMAMLEDSGSHVVSGLAELADQLQGQIVSLVDLVTRHHEACTAFAETVLTTLDETRAGAERDGHTLALADQAVSAVQAQQHAVEQAHGRLQQVAQSLQAHATGVRETGRTVTAIAGQSSLLALNARIEAARSHAGGQGFAVVAAAFGDLAVQAKAAASRITELNGKVEQGIEETVSTVATTAQAFQAQQAATGAVCGALADFRQSHSGMVALNDKVAGEVRAFAGSQQAFTQALEALTESAAAGQAIMQAKLFELFEHLQTADICRQQLSRIEATLAAIEPAAAG